MKNNNILIGVVVVVVLALLGWAISNSSPSSEVNQNNKETSSINTQTKTPTPSVTPSHVTSLPNTTNTFPTIFNQAGSHQCTYEQVSPSTRSTNVVYIADGKMRGEFRSTDGQGSTANLMVYNNGTLYVWQEGKAIGTKNVLKSVSDLPVIIPKDLTSGAVINSGSNSVGWTCNNWIKDNSLLAPPSYVSFY